MAGVEYESRTTVARGEWRQDELGREHVTVEGGRLNAAAFPFTGQITVTTSGAALAATTMPVTALAGPLPNGTILDFTGIGELVKLTAAAVTGATSLSVEALDAAVEAGDTATYIPAGAKRYVPSGTLVGRTWAERDAGAGFGPFASGDNEVYLTNNDVSDATVDPEVSFYRPGGLVAEKYLPTGQNLTEIRARYQCIAGRG